MNRRQSAGGIANLSSTSCANQHSPDSDSPDTTVQAMITVDYISWQGTGLNHE